MPTVFKPMMINGRLLVDGGNTMPVPVKMVKEMGADIVVAVNLYGKMFPYKREYLKKQELSLISVTRITYQMLIESLASENTKEADIVINPKIWEGEFNIFKNLINNQETTIEDGERAARDVIPAIKKLLY